MPKALLVNLFALSVTLVEELLQRDASQPNISCSLHSSRNEPKKTITPPPRIDRFNQIPIVIGTRIYVAACKESDLFLTVMGMHPDNDQLVVLSINGKTLTTCLPISDYRQKIDRGEFLLLPLNDRRGKPLNLLNISPNFAC